MSLPNTQKVSIDQYKAIKPDWYDAILVGHVEKSNQSVISSHIEFELTGAKRRLWAVLPHDEGSLALIKRLKRALGMKDEDTDLHSFHNSRLRIYVDNIFRDGLVTNEIKDFDKCVETQASENLPDTASSADKLHIEVSGKKVPRHILICDDQREVAALIANYIEQIGFTPEIVPTVDEAVECFDPDKYLMVITDVIMPGKNGFDLVRSLHNKYRNISIALISGYFDKEMESLQKLFGIDRIYRKPVFFKSVKEMVASAIKKYSPAQTVQP